VARSQDRAVIAVVHPVEVAASFSWSLLALALRDQAVSHRVANILNENSSANITNARNSLVRRFLTEQDAPWLLLIDADMAFDPDVLDRLLDSAHDASHPVVGALCYGVNMGGLFPTLYQFRDNEDGVLCAYRYDTFPDDRLFEVDATGAAFLLVHRRVLQRMRDHGFDRAFPWFAESAGNGKPVGEDITFCVRASIVGVPTHVHTGVRIGHHKSVVLTEDGFDEELARLRAELRGTRGQARAVQLPHRARSAGSLKSPSR
jgi:GT2 family glycosyltransferase